MVAAPSVEPRSRALNRSSSTPSTQRGTSPWRPRAPAAQITQVGREASPPLYRTRPLLLPPTAVLTLDKDRRRRRKICMRKRALSLDPPIRLRTAVTKVPSPVALAEAVAVRQIRTVATVSTRRRQKYRISETAVLRQLLPSPVLPSTRAAQMPSPLTTWWQPPAAAAVFAALSAQIRLSVRRRRRQNPKARLPRDLVRPMPCR